MSAIRPLLAPLTGTAVAGVVLYSMAASLSTRTHQLSDAVHYSSFSLRRLAQVDDTEDLLSRAHVAPDASTMATTLRDVQERERDKLRAAYTSPSRPSLREEVKARWNEHLFAFTQFLSETDLNHAIDATTSTFSRVYAGVTGQATSAEPSSISKLAGRVFHTAQTSASAAPPATLRDPLPPRHDVRLDATNTHYVGQGTNLR